MIGVSRFVIFILFCTWKLGRPVPCYILIKNPVDYSLWYSYTDSCSTASLLQWFYPPLLVHLPFHFWNVKCGFIWFLQFNYSSGQPAPESITDKIYGNTLSVRTQFNLFNIWDITCPQPLCFLSLNLQNLLYYFSVLCNLFLISSDIRHASLVAEFSCFLNKTDLSAELTKIECYMVLVGKDLPCVITAQLNYLDKY
mgnify:CR=1 FL=1